MKYLGVTVLSSRSFKIFTEQSRRAFHRTAVFGRIGRVAAEEVALQSLRSIVFRFVTWSCGLSSEES